jgi:hypothetical protein
MKGIASTGAPKTLLGGWVVGWMGGRESGVKDCLQQSKILKNMLKLLICIIFQKIYRIIFPTLMKHSKLVHLKLSQGLVFISRMSFFTKLFVGVQIKI